VALVHLMKMHSQRSSGPFNHSLYGAFADVSGQVSGIVPARCLEKTLSIT
jgi:hypothetical protein